MKALTALNRPGGDYAAIIQSRAEIMEDPPRRGATMAWAGQTYRLNPRAVDDILIAYNLRAADCERIVHLRLAAQVYRLAQFPPPPRG